MSDAPVTILFTDVEGSTALRAARGDAEAQEILRSCDALARQQIAAHGGHAIKSLGDGVMASFASPVKAVICALAIGSAMAEQRGHDMGGQVRLRMGLHTGMTAEEAGDLFGAAVNAAARIADRARGGEVLVSETVRQLCGTTPGVTFEDRSHLRLRGFPQRWHLYRVASESSSPPSGGPSRARAAASTSAPTGLLGFRVLGPLEVVRDGHQVVELGAPRQRAVVAALLLQANHVVPLTRLIDQVWGDDPPPGASGSLQAYVSNLRRALEPDRAPRETARVLRSQPPGYLLVVEPCHYDAARFERLAQKGRALLTRNRPQAALDLLTEGLALWRGPALAEFTGERFARAEAVRLEELRVVATEDCIQARLTMGEHGLLVADLQHLVTEQPLRERLWGFLMMALYRSGRQGDALGAFRECRRTLVEELGIEPGPDLQRLEHDILTQAASLEWRTPVDEQAVRPVGVVAPCRSMEPAKETPVVSLEPACSLVGRDDQLARLDAALTRALAGEGQLVLVAGEAGIGKTRLAEEFAKHAAERGAEVVWARCHEGEGAPAFWPWVQALRAVVSPRPLTEVEQVLGPAMTSLLPLLPERREAPIPPGGFAEAAEARAHVYQAVTTLLLGVADHRGLVLVLDDLHWADVPSLQLLEFLAAQLGRARLLVLVTFRDPESEMAEGLASTLGALARLSAVQHIVLNGLAPRHVSQLIAEATGSDPSEAVVDAVHSRTDGNPFFLTELIRLLESEGRLAQSDAASALASQVPTGVRDVIRRRVRRLPQQTNALLTIAAIIGRDFDLRVVEAVAGLDDETALDRVELALITGIVTESPDAVGRFRFSHELVRETLYEGLSAMRRAQLHSRVGEALERLRAPQSESNATDLAHHFWQAVPVMGAARGLPHILQAAEETMANLGYEQAELQLRRALQLVRSLTPGEERDRLELWAQVRLGHLASWTKGQSALEAIDAYARAGELCAAVSPPAERLAALHGLFMGSWMAADLRTAADHAEQLLEIAHTSQDPRFLIAADIAGGITAFERAEFASARRHLEEAIVLADSLADPSLADTLHGDPRVIARCFCGFVLGLTGEADRAMARAREGLDLARRSGHGWTASVALVMGAWVAMACRDLVATQELAQAATEDATERGFALLVAVSSLMVGWALALKGQAGPALSLLTNSLRDIEMMGMRLMRSVSFAQMAEVQLRAGQLQEALVSVDSGLAEAMDTGERFYLAELYRLRAEVLLASGGQRAGEARDCLLQAIAVAQEQGASTLERRAMESLEHLCDEPGSSGATPTCIRHGSRSADALLVVRTSHSGPRASSISMSR